MSKTGNALCFCAGAMIGGAAAWLYAKDLYSRLAEEEINSVKEVYARREEKDTETPQTLVSNSKVQEKASIADYAERIRREGYTEYSKTIEEPAQTTVEAPYVISPQEFGELDGYTPVSLVYYADGVLADEDCEIIGDTEDIVGDGLEHFGDYEDDAVYVRNDARKCDYEILKDTRKFTEVLKTLPPKYDEDEED